MKRFLIALVLIAVVGLAIAQVDSINIAKQWMSRLEDNKASVDAVKQMLIPGDTLSVYVRGRTLKLKLTTAQKTAYNAFLKVATDQYKIVRDSTVKYLPR